MNRRNVRDTVLLSGWLFADLLLGLAVIFLANTGGIQLRAVPTPTPPPSPTPTQTPIPVPPPRLELSYHRLTIAIGDPDSFLNSSAQDEYVKSQVRGEPVLQGRSVGLVVAYGGANGSSASSANDIAGKMYRLLRSLAKSDPAFQRAVYYDKLHNFDLDPQKVILDIYLFSQ